MARGRGATRRRRAGHGRRALVSNRGTAARAPRSPMTIGYAHAHDLLEAYVAPRPAHDGDAFTALFAPDASVTLDPFAAPLVGHNDLRAYLLAAGDAERWYELAGEGARVVGEPGVAAGPA